MRDSRQFTEVARLVLERGYGVRFPAEGLSMGPTIRNGETILVEPVRGEDVRRGDILLYRWERGVRAHRVVRIFASAFAGGDPVFLLRGDAGGEDELVRADGIVGRVVSLERDERRIRLSGLVAVARRTLRRGASGIKRWVRGAGPEGDRACARSESATGGIAPPMTGPGSDPHNGLPRTAP